MATKKISLDPTGPTPDPLPGCKAGDKIIWTNNSGMTITGFTLPTCVSPQTSPAPLDSGKTTRKYTVNNGAKGTYPYTYVDSGPAMGTKNGTIDVGS